MEEVITQIKKKKELSYLDDTYIKNYIKKYLLQNPKTNLNSKKDVKKIIKFVRDKAHSVYGMFQSKNIKKREEFLKNKDFEKLLTTHISTRERLKVYPKLYKKIFSYIKPKSILDIGCGLNPVSYPYMKIKPKYIASDFNKKDMDFLTKFFKTFKINGKAVKLDLINDLKKLKKYKVDVCFLFKVLDSLESVKKYISYEIIKNINAKYIIVSFPLKTVSGKKEMKLKKRNWFEKVILRTGYTFKTFELSDELYYVIKT